MFSSVNPLSVIFADKLESDDREPVFTFDVSGSSYGILVPNIFFWIQLLTIIGLQGLVLAAFSTLTYRLIVKQRGTSTCYLFGFGFVIPMCLLLPRHLIAAFDIRNKVLKFMMSGILPTMTLFHCSEAMFGFCPPFVEESPASYAIYSASAMELKYDPKTGKPMKTTRKEILQRIGKFGIYAFALGGYLSLVSPFNYMPFDGPGGDVSGFMKLFSAGQLLNNLAAGVLFQLYLTTFCEGLLAATCVLGGVQANEVMHNPIFTSNSPSDFWGRKWNSIIHGVLKRGAFKPARKYFSKYVAAAVAFGASGIFHEVILISVFYVHDHEREANGECDPSKCWSPNYGGNLSFFIWNTVLICMEYTIGGWAIFSTLRRTIPQPFFSLIVISTALPAVHWFTDAYIRSDFFHDGQLGFPMIVQLS